MVLLDKYYLGVSHMKNVCILKGSPRKNGNTNALVKTFTEELLKAGASVLTFDLYDMNLAGCTACRTCQKDWKNFGCPQNDHMQQIFDAIMASDLIVLATPIYSWYCTPPMKAVLDRMVYGMNKFYGDSVGPALWAGKEVAIIATCGYRPDRGADLFEEGIRRYCKHSHLKYRGMLAERHLGYGTVFMDDSKAQRAIEFAKFLIFLAVRENEETGPQI